MFIDPNGMGEKKEEMKKEKGRDGEERRREGK